jgi:glycosyltransferase involved in cell wall biosynthesis
MKKKVSIILACYNVAKYLRDTLSSILNQTYDSIELIAVDDASTDNTFSILELWRPKFIERGYEMIVAQHTINKDVCAGINTGLALCSGDYISIPDADDYMYPDNISSFVSALEANPDFGWAMCDAEIVDEGSGVVYEFLVPRSSVYRNDFFDFLSARTPFNTWLLMARRDYFDRCIGKQIYVSRLTQEWSIVFPLSFYGSYLRIPKTLYRYIKHPNSKAGWIYGEIESVIQHNHDLKTLSHNVLSLLPLNNEYSRVARLALDLVYGFRIYEAQLARNHSTVETEIELAETIDGVIGQLYYEASFKLRIEYALDAILKARTEPLLQAYTELQSQLAGGYILYGAGRNFNYLFNAMVAAYGPPRYIWDNAIDKVINGVTVTPPDVSCDKLPVVITIGNTASLIKEMSALKDSGFTVFIKAKRVFQSLRGFEIERR